MAKAEAVAEVAPELLRLGEPSPAQFGQLVLLAVPGDTFRLLSTEATKRGVSLTVLLNRAVVEYLANHPVKE